MGVPTHTPAELHLSDSVHASESSQLVVVACRRVQEGVCRVHLRCRVQRGGVGCRRAQKG